MNINKMRTPWANPRVIGVILLVFIFGMACGALTMRLKSRQSSSRAAMARLENKKNVLASFKKELDLTPQQEEKMEIVLDDFMKYIHDLQVQMDEIRSHGRDQILKILNDEQKKKFETVLANSR